VKPMDGGLAGVMEGRNRELGRWQLVQVDEWKLPGSGARDH
jgi:hypothetical protein